MDWVMASIDFTAMELGTWSQRCIDLLGYSDCAELILNQEKDPHRFLGGSLAMQFDSDFCHYGDPSDLFGTYDIMSELKGLDEPCDLPEFLLVWKTTGHESIPLWSDFYNHYRTFAKPVGLGYPGGLGAKTLRGLAATTYGIHIS